MPISTLAEDVLIGVVAVEHGLNIQHMSRNQRLYMALLC